MLSTGRELRPTDPELRADTRVSHLLDALSVAGEERALLIAFLRDLLSDRELSDLANRWMVAQMLMEGHTQASTARSLKMSTKTVNEVAAWVLGRQARNGYWVVFDRLRARAMRKAANQAAATESARRA